MSGRGGQAKLAVSQQLAFALKRASEGTITCNDLMYVGCNRPQAVKALSTWANKRLFSVVEKIAGEDIVYRISSDGKRLLAEIESGERQVKNEGKTLVEIRHDFGALIECLGSTLPAAQLEREPTYLELCR